MIHAFWIPAFRLQEDVVPGITDALARDADATRHLPGRLQPAVRARALADALEGPRRHRNELQGLARRARSSDRAQTKRAPPTSAGGGCGIMSATAMSSRRPPLTDRPRRRPGPGRQAQTAGLHRAAGSSSVVGVAFSTLPDVGRAHVHRATARSTTSSSAEAILTVSLLAAPLFFLVGIGGFDYWFYWAAGRKTRPEDHSGHGAYTWKDYFRINTDHKVIGIQYTVNSFFFLLSAA